MSNADDTDLLMQLLDGELSEQDREQLLTRLQNDPALQSEWSAISLSKELLQQYGQKKQIGVIHREMMAEMNPTASPALSPVTGNKVHRMIPGRTVKINRLRGVAAVLLVVLSAVLYPYFSTTTASLYSSQYASYDAGSLRSTISSTIESDFRTGDRKKVLADYQAGLSTGPKDDFLAGTVYLQRQEPLSAAASFEKAIKANQLGETHFLEPETQYYLALAWLAANEPKKALPLFSAIRADRNNPYHDSISWWFMLKLRRLAAR